MCVYGKVCFCLVVNFCLKLLVASEQAVMIYRTCLDRFPDSHKVFLFLASFEFIVIQILMCFVFVALCFING